MTTETAKRARKLFGEQPPLSARQRRVAKYNTPEARREECREIAQFLLNMEKPSRRDKPPQSKPHKLTARERRRREVNRRADKLLSGYVPKSHHKIDARLKTRMESVLSIDTTRLRREAARTASGWSTDQIEIQVQCQREEYQPRLRRLYSAFAAYNATFFGGELAMPILTVKPLRAAQATCAAKGRECEIAFAPATMARHISDVQDILLHEMVHFALEQFGGDKYQPLAGGWHHSKFADVCNAIAKQRDWPNVSHTIRGTRKAAEHWPPRTHF